MAKAGSADARRMPRRKASIHEAGAALSKQCNRVVTTSPEGVMPYLHDLMRGYDQVPDGVELLTIHRSIPTAKAQRPAGCDTSTTAACPIAPPP